MPQLEVSAVPPSVHTTDIWVQLARNGFCRSCIDDDPLQSSRTFDDEADVLIDKMMSNTTYELF